MKPPLFVDNAFIDMSSLNHKNSALARAGALESQFEERRSAAESISKSIAYKSLRHACRGQAIAADSAAGTLKRNDPFEVRSATKVRSATNCVTTALDRSPMATDTTTSK
jgi:hypothetical protein